MISDIPSHEDFELSGVVFLNLAWDAVREILFTLDESEIERVDEEDDDDEKLADEFWAAAQKPLMTALALVQQATEILLKGKIAAVSPYLLITGDPRSWPKGCDKENTPFTEFRTIDAQDLIRVYNTVSNTRLDQEFIASFEELRRIRNRIMHSVDKNFKTTPKEIVTAILEVIHNVVAPCGWIERRRDYLYNHPSAIAYYSTEHVEGHLAQEILYIIDLLDKPKFHKYFGANLRNRRYHCLHCNGECSEFSLEPKLAQLVPNEPASTNLHCYLCGVDRTVVRKRCIATGCRSNVIDADEDICLVCLEVQDAK
jgi:hypothetical protein